MARRHPIVAVLGHIDHGKTTLLDKIRQTNVAGGETGPPSVAAGEAGGITQHIGAYEVEIPTPAGAGSGPRPQASGKITFLDTPGHEAFAKMRSRGARVADVALLVVAADDGVKPQTREALLAINEAGVPLIVVLNKIDKDAADPERVKKELGDAGVYLEERGGKTPLVKVSDKTGEGISELLEMILLVSEMENLECDFSKPASGVVIESHLDSKRGNSATLLSREGILRTGNFILAGRAAVKVKILEDFLGQGASELPASSPALVAGFDRVPAVGSSFQAFATRDDLERATVGLPKENGVDRRPSEDGPLRQGSPPRLGEAGSEASKVLVPLILKADTAGSLEAVEHELRKLEGDGLRLNFLRRAPGNISEDDLKLASSSQNVLVLGFKVKTEKSAEELAARRGITVKTFEIIYELGDFLKTEVEKIMPEERLEKVLGRAKVLKVFKKDGRRQVVGGRVLSGGIFDGVKVRLLRRDFPLGEGKILELQAARVRTREVSEGEFGAMLDLELEIVPGDELQIYEEEFAKKKL
ncbi:MAG TPA: translation initiation factor IF-2 [Candidatus Paceibacterota bacterium]